MENGRENKETGISTFRLSCISGLALIGAGLSLVLLGNQETLTFMGFVGTLSFWSGVRVCTVGVTHGILQTATGAAKQNVADLVRRKVDIEYNHSQLYFEVGDKDLKLILNFTENGL